jgi:colanic acid biosynthesis glycosyl transferase WcaI
MPCTQTSNAEPALIYRVFFLNRFFFPDDSATAQLLTDLAISLAASGVEVHVVCSRQLYNAPATRLAAVEIVEGVFVHRIWTTRFGRQRLAGRVLDYASFYLMCGIALLLRLRSTDILVAETDPPLISIIAAAVGRFKGAALINWLQDIFPEVASHLGANPLPEPLDRVLRRLRDASLRAADANVVLGRRMLDYIVAEVATAKCHIIENWADANLVRPKSSGDSNLRIRLGLTGKFIIGYSGNLGRAHEYETVLGAAEILRTDERFVFLFVGGGIKMESLQAEVMRRGLQNFRFLPYQPRTELEDSLSAPDVHLVSLVPKLEGLIVPSKFYGILAAGRPALFVGDSAGELSCVIKSANCGMVIEIGNSVALADAITNLEADIERRSAMGRAARRLLCSSYATHTALARWAKLLAEVGLRRAGR